MSDCFKSVLSVKKVLSVLLSFSLIFAASCLVNVSASTGGDACGANLTSSFDDSTGTLTISGEGDMYNLEMKFPWSYYKSDIKTIIIEDGVTSISDSAFEDCSSLTSVVIPGSVTRIGFMAFSDCGSLSSIIIPDGVICIDDYAFESCESLTNVVIPDSVTRIGRDAFVYTGFYENASDWENDVLYIGNHLVKAKETVSGSYEVKEGTLVIADYAFSDCKGLASITIPDSVTSIGRCAFSFTEYYYNASNWENDVLYIGNHLIEAQKTISDSYEIKEGTLVIADRAFFNCMDLTSIAIPDTVKGISNEVFYNCGKLTNITVDSDNMAYSSDEYGVLFNKDKTILIQYPDGNASTGYVIPDSVIKVVETAFAGCNNLTSIIIPDSVTSIGRYAFSWMHGLTRLTVDSDNTVYSSDEHGVLFNKDKTVLIQYPIGNLRTSYIIPDSVINIAQHAFDNGRHIENVTISNSVSIIETDAFISCINLTSITIPDGVNNIGDNAFNYCTSLTSIIISDSVTRIGDHAFFNTEYYNDESNWENDVLYIGKHLIETKETISDSYKVKEGTLVIADRAFLNCDDLTSIAIPDSVTNIGIGAFNSCSNLADVWYSGTKEDWNAISIDLFNDPLKKAKIHCKNFWGSEDGSVLAEFYDGALDVDENDSISFDVSDNIPDEVLTEFKVSIPGKKLANYKIAFVKKTEGGVKEKVRINGGYKITVRIQLDKDKIPDNASFLVYHISSGYDNDQYFGDQVQYDPESGYITFEVEHFSYFFVYLVEDEPATKAPTLKIRNNPGVATVNYGDTLRLTADVANLPEGCEVWWFFEDGTAISGEEVGTMVKKDDTVTVKILDSEGNPLIDENGNEISDTQEIKVNDNFLLRIISFFKNLFRIDRVVVQSLFKKI